MSIVHLSAELPWELLAKTVLLVVQSRNDDDDDDKVVEVSGGFGF